MKKEKTVFQMILTAMLGVLGLEILMLLAVLYFSKMRPQMNQNAMDIVKKQVENRSAYLENVMLDNEDLKELSDRINRVTEVLLREERIDLKYLDKSGENAMPLLEAVTGDLIQTLRSKSVTGIFMVLNTEDLDQREEDRVLPGVYIRDLGVYYTFNANGQMTTKTPLTENDALGKQIAAYAQQFIGYPYVWGGDTDLTQGVDCSGFTMLVMKHFKINIPRTTWSQYDGSSGYKKPIKISTEDLKPGDLIFYYAGNTHVGIYIGDGKIVHASNSAPYPQGGIKVSSYDYAYIYGCVRYWYTSD